MGMLLNQILFLQVLSADENNSKAFYRQGQAHSGKKDYELALVSIHFVSLWVDVRIRYLFVGKHPSSMSVYLRDGPAQTVKGAVTPR